MGLTLPWNHITYDEELKHNIYVTGQTNSANFPQKHSVHPLQGSYDVFLTKMYIQKIIPPTISTFPTPPF